MDYAQSYPIQYEDFVADYDVNFCRSCPHFKERIDFDAGGAERAGGMAPQRVIYRVCSGTYVNCGIERYKAASHGS